jgi:excisionase family DNA binding protein
MATKPYLLSEAEQAQVRAWCVAGVPLEEQARRLGRPASNLMSYRRRLAREGVIAIPPRAETHRPWTAHDLDLLVWLLDHGHSYALIARRLRRTETSVKLKCKRLGVSLLGSRATLSCRDVAGLLGLPCGKTVSCWISGYGLRARNGGTKRKPLWRVQWDDPHHWMAFEPERCTDRLLREHLIESRQGQPAWLTIGAAARRLGVDSKAVNTWIHKGWLPATRYGNWWIRESDLVGFVVPGDRDRTGIPRGVRRVIDGRDRLVAGAPISRKAA